jgi:MYXO-CTERM domain-containing protein
MTTQNKKLCAYAAISAALTLSPLAAFGQASPATSPVNDTTTSSQTTVRDDRGDGRVHHNYGWVGLLGLLGLAGLMRKRDDRVNYSDRTDTRRATA